MVFQVSACHKSMVTAHAAAGRHVPKIPDALRAAMSSIMATPSGGVPAAAAVRAMQHAAPHRHYHHSATTWAGERSYDTTSLRAHCTSHGLAGAASAPGGPHSIQPHEGALQSAACHSEHRRRGRASAQPAASQSAQSEEPATPTFSRHRPSRRFAGGLCSEPSHAIHGATGSLGCIYIFRRNNSLPERPKLLPPLSYFVRAP
jgi:hypothetical protein